MLLKEMWSPIGNPGTNHDEVDYIDDLKFYIDNDNEILSKVLFPAILKHKQNIGNPKIYKLYIKPINRCVERYCEQFEIENPAEIFPKGKLIEFAKMIADTQEKIIKSGAYE